MKIVFLLIEIYKICKEDLQWLFKLKKEHRMKYELTDKGIITNGYQNRIYKHIRKLGNKFYIYDLNNKLPAIERYMLLFSIILLMNILLPNYLTFSIFAFMVIFLPYIYKNSIAKIELNIVKRHLKNKGLYGE